MTSRARRNGPHSLLSPAMMRTLSTAGFALEPRQKLIECLDAREIAHGKMRHRFETGGTQLYGMADCFVSRPPGHHAQISFCAGPLRCERGNIGRRWTRHLDRKFGHERADLRDRP